MLNDRAKLYLHVYSLFVIPEWITPMAAREEEPDHMDLREIIAIALHPGHNKASARLWSHMYNPSLTNF